MKKLHTFSEKSYRKETIFQIMYIVYPVLALVGFLGNLLTIIILSRRNCGLSNCITRYLVAMSTADLMLVVTDVILIRMNFLFYPVCFLDLTHVCALGTTIVCVAADCSAWLTVAFTFDRFVAICWQRASGTYSTKRMAAVVIGVIWAMSCASNTPWYLSFEPSLVIRNVSWFCNTKESSYSSLAWIAFNWVDLILTPFIPFGLILAFNALTVRHILAANKIRKSLLGHSKAGNTDSEMENRRNCVILLFALSGSFMLFWSGYVVYIIYGQFVNYYYTSYNHPFYVLYQAGIMLQVSNSATNTCIYAVTQTKFREEVKKTVKYPFVFILKLFYQCVGS